MGDCTVYCLQLYNPQLHKYPFYKIGFTSFETADYRLRKILESHPGFCWKNSKVIQTFQHPSERFCRKAEKYLQTLYPKNKWFADNFSGITECFTLSSVEEFNKLKDDFTKIRYHFKNKKKKINENCARSS